MGGALRQFDLLSDDVKNTDTPLDVDYLLKGLAWYSPLQISFKKACNSPLYEKTMQLKGEALCRALN